MFAKKSLGPDPRSKSVVEAEKGETVLTNKSRGLNNIVEMYNISGKKHSAGGTTLDLPVNDEGTGTSFIFSDKLKITDPAVLEMFGSKKKQATYAELSKKHVSIINDSKLLLLDKNSDDYTKKSAEKNIETSMTQLNKLKVLQESEKGFPNGMPSGTENFFKEMAVNPEDLLAPNDEMNQMVSQAQQKAMGGIVRKGFLPKAEKGGDIKWGDKDPNAKVQYDYIENVLGKNEKFKNALYQQYLVEAQKKDNYGKGYSSMLGKPEQEKFVAKTPEEVFQDYKEFQKRNLVFKSNGLDVASTSQNPSKTDGKRNVSNEAITKWGKEYGVPIPNMDKAVKEQLSYIAFEKLAANKDKYESDLKEVLLPFGASQFGASDERIAGSSKTGSISPADGAYTNTTAGQISFFTPEKIVNLEKNPKLTFEEDPNSQVAKFDTTGEKANVDLEKKILENPLGYRSQDIRNLNRAISSRAGIRRYSPFMISPELKGADAAYYSPERAIAAIMEQVGSAEGVSKAFGDAQGATAGALALSGNAFSATADVISNYADKNVGLFNNVANANAERASKQNAMDADIRTRLYADNVDMSEKFRRGVEIAKDKIVVMKNAAEKNMSDLYNLNRTNEQFKIDPRTGLVYITNEKELKPSSSSNIDDMGEEFQSFRKTLPADISNDLALKAFMGFKTGKLITDESTSNVTPKEIQ